MNCNPAGLFHYIKTDFIDKADEKSAYRIRFSMSDNLTLSKGTLERYKRMFQGVFYQRFILGRWALADGVIYSMFDETNLIDDKGIPEGFLANSTRYISIDYGTRNPRDSDVGTQILSEGHGHLQHCFRL